MKSGTCLHWRCSCEDTKGHMTKQAKKSSSAQPYTSHARRAFMRMPVCHAAKTVNIIHPMYDVYCVSTSPMRRPIQQRKKAAMPRVWNQPRVPKSFMLVSCIVTYGAKKEMRIDWTRSPTGGPPMRGWNPSVQSKRPVLKRVIRWMSSSMQSHLSARHSAVHMKQIMNVYGKPEQMETARSPRSAWSFPPTSSAHAHAPSVTAQYTRCTTGGWSMPPAESVSST
mmetsp:Transcript_33338/g.78597  ORF Transcript_33338/g.78597 Transcript_33338/m.78597 type:complete len:224 (+) Transcript_33338:394-1065(+)